MFHTLKNTTHALDVLDIYMYKYMYFYI